MFAVNLWRISSCTHVTSFCQSMSQLKKAPIHSSPEICEYVLHTWAISSTAHTLNRICDNIFQITHFRSSHDHQWRVLRHPVQTCAFSQLYESLFHSRIRILQQCNNFDRDWTGRICRQCNHLTKQQNDAFGVASIQTENSCGLSIWPLFRLHPSSSNILKVTQVACTSKHLAFRSTISVFKSPLWFIRLSLLVGPVLGSTFTDARPPFPPCLVWRRPQPPRFGSRVLHLEHSNHVSDLEKIFCSFSSCSFALSAAFLSLDAETPVCSSMFYLVFNSAQCKNFAYRSHYSEPRDTTMSIDLPANETFDQSNESNCINDLLPDLTNPPIPTVEFFFSLQNSRGPPRLIFYYSKKICVLD